MTFSSKLDWALALSLLIKLPPRKLEPWFVLWSFILLRLLCIFTSLPGDHAWNTVVMSGLVLLVATWNCWIRYKNGYARLLVLLFSASHEPLAQVFSLSLFYRYLVDVHLNWLNWFHFLILKGGLLVILIDCMIFLSPRMPTSTVPLVTQLDSGIFHLYNAFLWAMI